MASDKDTRGLGDSVGNDDLLDLVSKVLLDGSAEILVVFDVLLSGLLLLWSFFEFKTLLGHTDQLLAVKLLELSNGVLIDRVDKEQDGWDGTEQSLGELDKDNRKLWDPEEFHGAPVGLQLVGRRFEDEKIVGILEHITGKIGLPLETVQQ